MAEIPRNLQSDDDSQEVSSCCFFCEEDRNDVDFRVRCPNFGDSGCSVEAHPHCFAEYFLRSEEAFDILIPATPAECPNCAAEITWPMVIAQQYKI